MSAKDSGFVVFVGVADVVIVVAAAVMTGARNSLSSCLSESFADCWVVDHCFAAGEIVVVVGFAGIVE